MPAAAVIPAPIAYINVVAVKKLVVESLGSPLCLPSRVCTMFRTTHPSARTYVAFTCHVGDQILYLEKIRVFQAGNRWNTLAWNNRIGPRSYLLVLWTEVMINRDSWGH